MPSIKPRPVRRNFKRGFKIEAVGDPRHGGLGVQPPDAEKGLIFNVLRIASNCLNAKMHGLIK